MFLRGILATAVALAVTAGPVSASESYCVSCTGPSASYRCEVTLPVGVVPSQSPQLYCAYRLAAEGGHASCASRRSGAAPCPGDYRQLAYTGPSLVAPATATEGDVSAPVDAMPASVELDDDDLAPPGESPAGADDPAPKTLVELTEQVGKAISGSVDGDEAAKDAAPITDDVTEDAFQTDMEPPQSTSEKITSAARTALNCLASWFEECE
jgi:hypothetical protein